MPTPDDLPADLQDLCINTLRFLAIDAVETAGCGHPGTPMGAATMAFVLWHDYLRFDPADPDWPGRDRFVLSAGHASMLLYGLLCCAGCGLTLDDLRRFRQLGSLTPGHPERGRTTGVETTTGPLGQGFATGVGLALAARILAAQQDSKPEAMRFRNRVFGLVSDGDLQEGVAFEAAALAAHQGLGNLVYLHDANDVTIEGALHLSAADDVPARFRALGWAVEEIDGLDARAVRAALDRACVDGDRPTLIHARTQIGHGSPLAGSSACHGAPLGPENVAATRRTLGWPYAEPFTIPDEVREVWASWAGRQAEAHEAWDRAVEKPAATDRLVAAELLTPLAEAAAGGEPDAGRAISGRVMQRAAELLPGFLGGCADLSSSTKTRILDGGWISPRSGHKGRNIAFGIREHAMAAVTNGIALQGAFRPFCSTYLVFSDYLRPALRLAAQMELPVVHVYTHDSFLLGQDGPTHQPVEQLWSLRTVPGVRLFRPADGLEVAAAWASALASRRRPHVLVMARQSLPPLPRAADFDAASILRGGYVVTEPPKLDGAPAPLTIAATGSELQLALATAAELESRGRPARVVSLPCLELFREQPADYRRKVLPRAGRLCIIEAGVTAPWAGAGGLGSDDDELLVIGLDRFGASAPAADLAELFGFTAGAVARRVLRWLDEE